MPGDDNQHEMPGQHWLHTRPGHPESEMPGEPESKMPGQHWLHKAQSALPASGRLVRMQRPSQHWLHTRPGQHYLHPNP